MTVTVDGVVYRIPEPYEEIWIPIEPFKAKFKDFHLQLENPQLKFNKAAVETDKGFFPITVCQTLRLGLASENYRKN
ncbi:hypothetical protein IT568_04180 [bacterium]|nr:hypothetical protein [bacterium]